MRMPWSVLLDPQFPVIETIYSGLLSPMELAEAFEETKKLLISSGRKLLIADCSTLQGGHSITDLYHLAETFAKVNLEFPVKEAVILSEALPSSEMARFWETTCYNRGITVQVFSGRDEALAWLMDERTC